jgi:geranylgeranyl diphosphate synthase type I
MTQDIKNFVLIGGKRIRPILFYYGYLTAGGRNKKSILDASLSIELIHDYLLIHDDIIDRDELRRGRPTIHKRYQKFYQKISIDYEHLGISAGIIIGNLASAFGYEILTESNFPDSFKTKALKKLSQIIIGVQAGEILDVFLRLDHPLKEKEIFKIIKYKTTGYSIEGPLQLGAILAGANQKALKDLSNFALPLGNAFQIQDDILGMFGDPGETGKPVGGDLREGKQTLLISKAKELANKKEKKIIERTLGNPRLTKNQLKKVRKIIVKTGALDFCQKTVTKLINQAKQKMENSKSPPKIKNFLILLVDSIIEKEK